RGDREGGSRVSGDRQGERDRAAGAGRQRSRTRRRHQATHRLTGPARPLWRGRTQARGRAVHGEQHRTHDGRALPPPGERPRTGAGRALTGARGPQPAMATSSGSWFSGLLVVVAAAIVCAGLIVVLQPLLKRYAVARPNARSSHKEPTPQGGGIAVIAATVVVAAVAIGIRSPEFAALSSVLAATFLIAVLGAVDDIRPLDVGPRLVLQAVAVCAI